MSLRRRGKSTMALFNSRKRADPAPYAPAAETAPAAAPVSPVAQPTQLSAAPLGAALRLVSPSASPAAPASTPEPSVSSPEHSAPRAEDMRGLPLGTILYRQGLVEQTDLEEALAAGMESGERLGEVLI